MSVFDRAVEKNSTLTLSDFLPDPEGPFFRSLKPQTLNSSQLKNASLQPTVSESVSVRMMDILISAVLLLSFISGFGSKQTGSCRPFCSGDDCITVNRHSVDFRTAEEVCRESNGKLLTFQSKSDKLIFDIFRKEFLGNFWIGLRLQAGACSNLSTPLRGYDWISGDKNRTFIPFFKTWAQSTELCSPHCVALSNDENLTERQCSDKADGYLCKTKLKDACLAQTLPFPIIFQSSAGCKTGPCEHTCTDVIGGYKCSCFQGYIPDRTNPRQCKIHCAKEVCLPICENTVEGPCECADGFLLSDGICMDLDECDMNHCDQDCRNTIGSFVCSCREGFILEAGVKCTQASDGDRYLTGAPVSEFVKPAPKNSTVKSSSAPAGVFLWIWVVVAVAVLASVFVIRFYVMKRQRRREQSSDLQSTAPRDSTEG
ncbi:thrombomodulin [Cololabis saira]|uniref:thrombomodulin n=1 Tax=Cololabis saira TaxID=129043 RepID=UPI002AD37D08|nr:thrombomodulin [Cololabis saira]